MSSTGNESLGSAPLRLDTFRKGRQALGVSAKKYERPPGVAVRAAATEELRDSAEEECLELLDHLVDRLGTKARTNCPGLEDACMFLLQHLAERFPERVLIH
jgi:hypothetical protein